MNVNVPLSPHLEQFVRDQLARGRFQSEGDVIRAALRLLEGQSLAQGALRVQFGNDAARGPSARRSPRGILADLRSDIGLEEVKEARREMWAGFRQREAW